MRRSVLLDSETFVEDIHLRQKCGYHVQLIYYVSGIACVVMDLIGILIGMLLFFYPQKHRETFLYRQIFQHYDRTHKADYKLFYNISTILWINIYFLHILAIGVSIIGVQPFLMLPQMGILLLRIGILITMLCALITINITGDQPMYGSTFIVIFLLTCSSIFLLTSIWCIRSVYERYKAMQKMLANTKSVHFKEKRKRRK